MSDAAPDILVYPPTVSVAAPIIAVALEWLLPLHILPGFGNLLSVGFGVALMGLSGWLAMSGSRAFANADTNVDPHKPSLNLVTTGPYAFTRNPMYLGMVLLQMGLAFALSLDWALVAAPVVWAVLHYCVVLREEAYLTENFGQPYTSYLNRTRRWL